jgi:bacterioferritin-associated ferredoxin
MISEDFASTFIRRIYDFTPGEMEPFVRIGSLCQDCVQLFNQLIEESKNEDYHNIVKKEKHVI